MKEENLDLFKGLSKEDVEKYLETLGMTIDEMNDELEELAEMSEEEFKEYIKDIEDDENEKDSVKESLTSIFEAKYNVTAKTIAKDIGVTTVVTSATTPFGTLLYYWGRKSILKKAENQMAAIEYKKSQTDDKKEIAKYDNQLAIIGRTNFDDDGRFRGFLGGIGRSKKVRKMMKDNPEVKEAYEDLKKTSKENRQMGKKLRKTMKRSEFHDMIKKSRTGNGGDNADFKDAEGNVLKRETVKDPETGKKKKVTTHTGPRGGKFYWPDGKPKTPENRVYITKESIDYSLSAWLIIE